MPTSNRHPYRSAASLAGLASLALATPAGAGDQVAAVDEPAAPLEVTATVEQPVARYPRSVIARPLTLPRGLVAIGADAGGNHDLSAITGAPLAGCGITDELEVLVPYAFSARDFEARGSVAADAGYAFLRGALGGKLEAVARVRAGYDTLAMDPTPLSLGVHLQYNATPWLAVLSGTPGTQQLRIALAEAADGAQPIDVGLPLAIGVQPSATVYLQLDTRLVQLDLHDSATALVGRDTTPLALTLVWNVVPALDVQGAIGSDLSNAPGDALTFLVGARFYAGQL